MNTARNFKNLLILVLTLLIHVSTFAQASWIRTEHSQAGGEYALSSLPDSYTIFRVDFNQLKSILQKAPSDKEHNNIGSAIYLDIPAPEGNVEKFSIYRNGTMSEELAVQFPDIRTFSGVRPDNSLISGQFDFTYFGFHGMVMSPSGWYFIEPFSFSDPDVYIVYYRKDLRNRIPLYCGFSDTPVRQDLNPATGAQLRSSGATLKTYRLAVACTGEYAAFYGGTVSGAMSGITTSVNRVNGVYEQEVAVRMVLIGNNSSIVYTSSSSDPYTNNNGSTMLGQNQSNLDAVIGTANYDIGHVFSTGGGGVAYLGCVCSSANKARGVTGSSSPIGDNFDIDYVAHEMGHQFGGNHTFNSVTGSCSGNRASTAAYEPGSGTTIMAYAGICGADNIQPHSDPIFHTKSYDEIQTFITTGGGDNCDVASASGNNPPSVNAGANYTIPVSTPFVLTGSATDPNGDPLLYLWEQYDLGPSGSPNSPSGNAPIFRDFIPVSVPYRVFPRMEDLVRNTQTLGEILPSYARSLQFKFTARDNRSGGGGVDNNNTPVTLTVVNNGGAFSVTNPNTAVTWTGLTSQTVTWNVNGTNSSPINCNLVNILLSVDSGYTYPYTLAINTSNDGAETIIVPNIASNKARVKVEAVGNIFFDISNVNFTIQTGSGTLSSITTSAISPLQWCAGASINVNFSANGTANTGNVYTAQLSGPTGSFSSPVAIGSLSSTSSNGTINCVIPGATANGSAYRIRVVSSNPSVTGGDNGSNLSIFQPVSSVGVVSGSTSVCQGESGVVYSTPLIANANTYDWSLPSGASITSGSGTNVITVSYSSGAASGSVTVTGSNACGNGPVSAILNVIVNTLPAAAGSITGPSALCKNTSATYSISSIAGASNYSWSLPSGVTITNGAGTNSITVNISGSASYGTISVYGINSCGAGASSSLSLNAFGPASTPVIVAGGPVSFCQGGSVNLSFASVASEFYQWRKDGSAIPGANNSVYQATQTGAYDVLAYPALELSSGTSVSIPDFTCTGATSTINVSGFSGTVPSGNISITINIVHTYVGDLAMFLVAPDGSILGLSNRTGNNNNSGDNFTNTVFSDLGSIQIPTTGAPYTGTYKPWTSTFTSCITSNVTSFGAIGGGSINPNGDWSLRVFDRANQDVGTISNWTISFPGSASSPCPATSNSIAATVNPSPTITSINPTSGSPGTVVSINGFGFTGATSVYFGGTPASSYSVISDVQITATVPGGATTGLILVNTPCGSASSPGNFTVTSSPVVIQLKVFMEGFYIGSGKMQGIVSTTLCDTVSLSLASASYPFSITHTVKAVVDTGGNGSFTFPAAVFGTTKYLVVRHRNCMETWSATSIVLNSSTMNYQFSTAVSKAYGNNQRDLGDGRFAIWSGDINQDGIVNQTDLNLLETAAGIFSTGYLKEDLSGDRVVEGGDYALIENNAYQLLQLLKP